MDQFSKLNDNTQKYVVFSEGLSRPCGGLPQGKNIAKRLFGVQLYTDRASMSQGGIHGALRESRAYPARVRSKDTPARPNNRHRQKGL